MTALPDPYPLPEQPRQAAPDAGLADALERASQLPDAELLGRAEALKAKLTGQLASAIAKARAAEREALDLELAEALGLPADQAPEHGRQSLLAMVNGVRGISDIVMTNAGLAAIPGDEVRRRELLTAFGVAEQWARAQVAAELGAPDIARMLGLEVPEGYEVTVTAETVEVPLEDVDAETRAAIREDAGRRSAYDVWLMARTELAEVLGPRAAVAVGDTWPALLDVVRGLVARADGVR